jgi:hypothetical protein
LPPIGFAHAGHAIVNRALPPAFSGQILRGVGFGRDVLNADGVRMTLACYTNLLSVCPGEAVALHASAASGPCALEIARIGRGRVVVRRIENIAVDHHETPRHADRDGCDWPVALTFEIGADWRSGYYDLQLTDRDGGIAHHFICVKPARNGSRANAAFVLATNTYHAYNW